MKVSVYIRTSTDDQNPENQIRDCEGVNQWGEYTLYRDQQSAWRDDKERPQFESLRKQIKAGRVKHLIVWDLDRLYRRRLRIVEFFKLCNAVGCKIHSYRQDWLQSIDSVPEPWNEIIRDQMIQIMGWMAEEESSKKSERVKAAVRQKNGKTVSYKGNKWGRKSLSTQKRNKILALRSEGKTVRQIRDELGISIGAIHRTIKGDGNIEN